MYSWVKFNGLTVPYLKFCFHTSTPTCSSTNRQLKNSMRKLLGFNKKKKFYSETPTLSGPQDFSKGSTGGKTTSGNSRRSHVLNKLFMKYVTDLMATGEYSSGIIGYGIEVNRVRITPDFKILNVYWHTNSSRTDDDKVEQVLQKSAGYLRHELSQLKLIGNVPIIKFVKDKQYSVLAELDRLLNKADFGDDHVPIDPAEKLKSELEIIVPLEENVKAKLKKLDKEHEDVDRLDLPLPPMMQNVYGLDHAAILAKVKKSMAKSVASARKEPPESPDANWARFKVNQQINENPIYLGTKKAQDNAFKTFLLKRQQLQQKLKAGVFSNPDLEYLEEESWKKHMENMRFPELGENNEEDYIIEEIEEK